MITCRDVCQSASDLIDGEGRLGLRLQLRLHVLICRNCRAYVDQLRRTADLLRFSIHQPPPIEAEEQILAHLRSATSLPIAADRSAGTVSEGPER